MARSPDCHPDRVHRAKGMCSPCYGKAYLKGKPQTWRKNHPEQAATIKRKYILMREYGLTVEDYEALLSAQDHKCPICRFPFGEGRDPVVDHDHITGENRGVLCRQCNAGLGLLGDGLTGLLNAIEYLAGA